MAENELVINITAKSEQAVEALKQLTTGTEGMNESLVAVTELGAAAFVALIGVIGESVSMFAEQEKASRALSLALQNQGLYSSELAASYKETAEAIEQKTGADADQIVQGQALMTSLIGQQKITPELTRSIVDMAAATGVGLNQAFMAASRAVETGTLSIGRFHIQLDPTLTDSERLAKVQEILGQKFGGAAEDAVQGLNGWALVQAQFRELSRYIGQEFAPVFTDAMKIVKTDIEFLTPYVKDVAAAWNQYWPQIAAVFNAFVYSIIQRADGLRQVLMGVLHLNAEEIKAGAATFANAAVDAVASYNEEMEKGHVIEEMDLRDQNTKKLQLANKDAQDRKAIRDAEVAANKLKDQVAILELTAQGSKELELKKHQLSDLEKASKTHNATVQAALKADADQQVQQEQAIGQSLLDLDAKFHSQKIKDTQGALSELSSMQQSHNSTLKAIGKAAAVADIIANTEVAVMRVIAGFSSIPFIGTALGIAAAGAVIAYSGERIAQVVGANQGGVIVGGSPGRDSVPAMLTPGELVVPSQNFDQVVSAYASSQGMGGGGGGEADRLEIVFRGDAAEMLEAKILKRQRLRISLLKAAT